jgi:hypothetical protein
LTGLDTITEVAVDTVGAVFHRDVALTGVGITLIDHAGVGAIAEDGTPRQARSRQAVLTGGAVVLIIARRPRGSRRVAQARVRVAQGVEAGIILTATVDRNTRLALAVIADLVTITGQAVRAGAPLRDRDVTDARVWVTGVLEARQAGVVANNGFTLARSVALTDVVDGTQVIVDAPTGDQVVLTLPIETIVVRARQPVIAVDLPRTHALVVLIAEGLFGACVAIVAG